MNDFISTIRLATTGCQNRVFKLDTTEINENTFFLPIGGFHILTVYELLLTKKI